ncbi:MAG: glycoside hydrolase family 125 protein, partial [Bacteroidetes bacterium]|nr:glycoside hydrolase family 125 protein [Bacteroidota bacterium]
QTSLATAGFFITKHSSGFTTDFPVVRVPAAQRKFTSVAVENAIAEVRKNIGNKEIAWLFENCFPNTLDTTVDFEMINGKPDTYVITGDIDAMWLRDSSAQVWPYLPLTKEDKKLQQLINGVIRRQTKNILKDPYANAFYKDENKISEWKATDITDMKAGIHERKWEIDSLCYPIRLAHGYWKETGDTSAFDADWMEAMKLVVKTFKEQQRKENNGPYSFQRKTEFATDSIPLNGYGYPTKKVGLIHSMFRPSDDATIYPFLIPSNCFAVVSLTQLAELVKQVAGENELVKQAKALAAELKEAIAAYATINHAKYGTIYAYETNGFGSYNLMDDANVPSLLSLPYLNYVSTNDTLYKNTRQFLLSENNPFFFKGKAGEGIGGPHVGVDMIWPLSIIMRGLTSNDDKEIKWCLDTLQKSHAGTGFMHESFHKDDVSKFTRKWFAWANTIFGEFVWKVYGERKSLLS